jgi:hypothetical protein
MLSYFRLREKAKAQIACREAYFFMILYLIYAELLFTTSFLKLASH